MKLFISYNGCITGFGMCQSIVDNCSKVSMKVLQEIQKTLREEQKDDSLIIINWKRLEQ